VGVRGIFSEWVEVVSGIPQGSLLGPLLFILLVNDLPQWIKSSMRMFADDAKVWTIVNSQEDCLSLQNDLNT
jgi:Reverse transcriptase (RNA-dependent DNA polymerase)